MSAREPWEGDERCGKPGCPFLEIEGLGFCLHHVPAEDLDEAEAITGQRRCRKCDYLATATSDPPLCPAHVQEQVSPPPERRASAGFVEHDKTERLAAVMAEHGERLLRPPRRGDPIDSLLELEAEVSELRQILREKVATLEMSNWRYAHNRVGEQVRTEIYLYEQALDRHAKLLINIVKLRLRDHKLQLDKELVGFLIQKFGMALEASGADIEGQQRAREHLGRALAEITA